MSFLAAARRLFPMAMLFGALSAVALSASALDYVSVAVPTVLYDAPSLKAKKLSVAARYLPLEQVVSLDNWVKVRDSSAQLYWIEKRALSSKRFVMVNVAVAPVYQRPDVVAGVIFYAPQQLALEWLADAGDGWLQVRHLDGVEGYIRQLDVWGSR